MLNDLMKKSKSSKSEGYKKVYKKRGKKRSKKGGKKGGKKTYCHRQV